MAKESPNGLGGTTVGRILDRAFSGSLSSGLHLPESRLPGPTWLERLRVRKAGGGLPNLRDSARWPPSRRDRLLQALGVSTGGARSAWQAVAALAAESAGRVAVRGC